MPPISRGFFIDTLLPLAVFPALAVIAANTIFGHLFGSGAADKMAAQCSPAAPNFSAGPNYLTYTGLGAVDEQLCGIVTFFHGLMDPVLLPFHLDLFTSFGIIATITFVEAAREGRHLALAVPTLVGLLFQTATVGVVTPIYWLIFVLSGGSSLHFQPERIRTGNKGTAKNEQAAPSTRGGIATMVTKSHAEGILFGLFVGYIIPTVAMFVLEDPYVTAIWQVFPVWMSLAAFAHRLFRRSRQSGHRIIRNTYFTLFLVSFAAHSFYVWPLILNDRQLYYGMFVPSLAVPDPKTTTLAQGAVGFIQWDATFGFISSVLATFWFAGDVTQLLTLVVWYAVGTPFFGPGAATAGVFLWRENLLNGGN